MAECYSLAKFQCSEVQLVRLKRTCPPHRDGHTHGSPCGAKEARLKSSVLLGAPIGRIGYCSKSNPDRWTYTIRTRYSTTYSIEPLRTSTTSTTFYDLPGVSGSFLTAPCRSTQPPCPAAYFPYGDRTSTTLPFWLPF